MLASPYRYSKISFYSLQRCPLSSEGCSYLVAKYLQQSEKLQRLNIRFFERSPQLFSKYSFERKAGIITKLKYHSGYLIVLHHLSSPFPGLSQGWHRRSAEYPVQMVYHICSMAMEYCYQCSGSGKHLVKVPVTSMRYTE